MYNRHIVAAVHIKGIPYGINQNAVHKHIFHAFTYNRKMSRINNRKILEHYILAVNKSYTLVAVPRPIMPLFIAVLIIGRVSTKKCIPCITVLILVASVNKSISIYHYIVEILTVYKTVGKICVSVVLKSRIQAYLRLIIIASLSLAYFVCRVNLASCCSYNRSLFHSDVDIAFQSDCVSLILTLRKNNGSSVYGSFIYSPVNRCSVGGGRLLRASSIVSYVIFFLIFF